MVYLVQGIISITDELLKENFLVGIKTIDNEKHELGNFCLEGKSLHLLLFMMCFLRHLEGEGMQVQDSSVGRDCLVHIPYKKHARGWLKREKYKILNQKEDQQIQWVTLKNPKCLEIGDISYL